MSSWPPYWSRYVTFFILLQTQPQIVSDCSKVTIHIVRQTLISFIPGDLEIHKTLKHWLLSLRITRTKKSLWRLPFLKPLNICFHCGAMTRERWKVRRKLSSKEREQYFSPPLTLTAHFHHIILHPPNFPASSSEPPSPSISKQLSSLSITLSSTPL